MERPLRSTLYGPHSQHQKTEKHTSASKMGHSLVGTVDVVNGQDCQVAVITEITEGDSGAGLQFVIVDNLLGDVEGNGHGKDVAIRKAAVLADAMHISHHQLCVSLPG